MSEPSSSLGSSSERGINPALPTNASRALPPGVPIPVGAAIPRTHGPLAQAIGRLWLTAGRWRLAGEVPDVAQAIIIVAPHTSNWDFCLGLAIKYLLRLEARWLGKHTLFAGPLGGFFHSIGGIPVDRTRAGNLVQAAVEAFAATPRMLLVLAPEGSRSARMQWKSGFYHIARGADVPVIPVTFDWPTRVVTFLPPERLGPDHDAELARLQTRYADVRGRR
jgi:1-acyl-sn-glycerol-3-phosphate acyltransferase